MEIKEILNGQKRKKKKYLRPFNLLEITEYNTIVQDYKNSHINEKVMLKTYDCPVNFNKNNENNSNF